MKTSYREISKTEFEVSVTLDDGETEIIGILSCDYQGKWHCTKKFFSTMGGNDTFNSIKENEMVLAGRCLQDQWALYNNRKKIKESQSEALKKYAEKTYDLSLPHASSRNTTNKKIYVNSDEDLDDFDFDSFWDFGEEEDNR